MHGPQEKMTNRLRYWYDSMHPTEQGFVWSLMTMVIAAPLAYFTIEWWLG